MIAEVAKCDGARNMWPGMIWTKPGGRARFVVGNDLDEAESSREGCDGNDLQGHGVHKG